MAPPPPGAPSHPPGCAASAGSGEVSAATLVEVAPSAAVAAAGWCATSTAENPPASFANAKRVPLPRASHEYISQLNVRIFEVRQSGMSQVVSGKDTRYNDEVHKVLR